MANETNYGWAYVHPTASQAQARGVDKSIQFLSGAVDSNGIGTGSGSAKLTFDYTLATPQLFLSGNMTSSGHVSASVFYGDGTNLQGVSSFPYNGNAVITGSLNVTEGITASNYLIENTFEINNSGSSNFGNSNDDNHIFTGSLMIGASGSNVDVQYILASSQLKVPGLRVNYRSLGTTAFTASQSDYIVGVSANISTAVTVELPPASTGAGLLLVIKDEATGGARSSGNAITVSASSGDTVDDVNHVTIAGTMASKTFYSNGVSKWFVI
tara:strand:- start:1801 stop:2610 length:810 start_codon:yes stop_codon:yes gene_type:complete